MGDFCSRRVHGRFITYADLQAYPCCKPQAPVQYLSLSDRGKGKRTKQYIAFLAWPHELDRFPDCSHKTKSLGKWRTLCIMSLYSSSPLYPRIWGWFYQDIPSPGIYTPLFNIHEQHATSDLVHIYMYVYDSIDLAMTMQKVPGMNCFFAYIAGVVLSNRVCIDQSGTI